MTRSAKPNNPAVDLAIERRVAVQKSQPFRREADKPVEPRLLEARLKFLVCGNSGGEGTVSQDSGAMRAFGSRLDS